jgi:ABC-type phosphate/phosphonate transport system substrate-binding protein
MGGEENYGWRSGKMKRSFIAVLAVVLTLVFSTAFAADFKFAIMQDKAGAARKFKPLFEYMAQNGISAEFVAAKDYSAAAQMFSQGKVDAMFSGSGVAGSMIIKEIANPLVRPVSKDGTSTYWAVVLAPKGSSRFSGKADYFKGKKVIFAGLASSGEFFFRAIPGSTNVGAKMLKASNHGAAIDALNRGRADIAVVKNRVWDKEISKYSGLERVGEDSGENPNGTLIVSKNANSGMVKKVKRMLLALEADSSSKATAAKDALGIRGYKETTIDDFSHTLKMLGNAGVDKGFNFKY